MTHHDPGSLNVIRHPAHVSSKSNHTSVTSSNMDVLLRMGFSKDRAENALTCTGDVSAPAAIDWILSHKDDPAIDVKEQREYLVYLTPSGALLERLHEFLRKTADISGRNGAHLHMPHITMCHAFKTDASNIPMMVKMMQEACAGMADRLPGKLKLERYTSENFMGLFLDKEAEKVLKECSNALVTSFRKLSGKQIPYNSDKAFHLTLAYHFDPGQYEAIHGLSKRIPLKTPAQWNFLLLSRDARYHSHEVFQMVHPWGVSGHHEPNELPYNDHDYVYIPTTKPEDKSTPHKPGWVSGVSWATGCPGVVPMTGLSQIFASDVWILHGCMPYGSSAKVHHHHHGAARELDIYPPGQRLRWVQTATSGHGGRKDTLHPAEVSSRKLDRFGVERELPWKRHSTSSVEGTNGNGADGSSATAYVMRHGERMDFVFGVDWIHKCFDDEGNFTRSDLNMPKSIPKRRQGPAAYIRDPPLTVMGLLQAQLTGKAMKDAGITFTRAFVSPALRSVQTAQAVLEACAADGHKPTKLCIEPGLYEWLGWVKEAHPDWLTPTELQACGTPVDLDYQPYFHATQLDFNEDVEGFYTRNGHVLRKVMMKYGHEGGNFLFVAHASSLDTCTRQLVGASPRSHFEMNRVTQRVPYCAVVSCCQGGPDHAATWMLKNPPFPTLTHGVNIKFDAVQTFVTTSSSSSSVVATNGDSRHKNGTVAQKVAAQSDAVAGGKTKMVG